MRAINNTLPFNNMPAHIIIKMAKHAIYWLNAFPHLNGVSDTLSPQTIITGQTIDFINTTSTNSANTCKLTNRMTTV
jgi:hypothetical protein